MAKNKINLLVKNIGITKIDEKITKSALSNKRVNDFEDGLEYYSALNQNCRFIVTENQQDFYFSEIEIFGCEEFLKRL